MTTNRNLLCACLRHNGMVVTHTSGSCPFCLLLIDHTVLKNKHEELEKYAEELLEELREYRCHYPEG